MLKLADKKDLILAAEMRQANAVSAGVIEKPKLSLWMILIPVIFVHFFYRLQKYSEGRKQFARDFCKSRKRALEEAASAIASGEPPDVNKLVQMASIPKETNQAYHTWLKVLVEHYIDLLEADGDAYEVLVRNVYKNRTNYLLFLNQLNEVEKAFDDALKPHLYKDTEGVNDIVATMETHCVQFRRAEAARIFK